MNNRLLFGVMDPRGNYQSFDATNPALAFADATEEDCKESSEAPIHPGESWFICPGFNVQTRYFCGRRITAGWVMCPQCWCTFFYAAAELRGLRASRALAAVSGMGDTRAEIKAVRKEAFHKTGGQSKLNKVIRKDDTVWKHR